MYLIDVVILQMDREIAAITVWILPVYTTFIVEV